MGAGSPSKVQRWGRQLLSESSWSVKPLQERQEQKSSAQPELCTDPDEVKAYQERMGRWRADVKYGINLPWFWIVLHCTHLAHKPLAHILNLIEASSSVAKVNTSFLAYQLVTGKAHSIFCEFIQGLAHFEFATLSMKVKAIDGDATSLEVNMELAIRLVVHVFLFCVCEYHQRICVYLNWPKT